MELDEFNEFCRSRTAATHVIQWGDAHVWKVGGKVFGLGLSRKMQRELGIAFAEQPVKGAPNDQCGPR